MLIRNVLFGAETLAIHPMRALLCVGVAYFLIGVVVPAISLGREGKLNGFNLGGTVGATAAGAAFAFPLRSDKSADRAHSA